MREQDARPHPHDPVYDSEQSTGDHWPRGPLFAHKQLFCPWNHSQDLTSINAVQDGLKTTDIGAQTQSFTFSRRDWKDYGQEGGALLGRTVTGAERCIHR